jgi:hypothetical protein
MSLNCPKHGLYFFLPPLVCILLSTQLYPQGSFTEILYSLQTFGISPNQIPVILSSSGVVKTQHHLKWIQMRQAMEKARTLGGPNFAFPGIECPSHCDVLLGRGIPNHTHRGEFH